MSREMGEGAGWQLVNSRKSRRASSRSLQTDRKYTGCWMISVMEARKER